MADTTVKKVSVGRSPEGEEGQKYLVSGRRVSMRIWEDQPEGVAKPSSRRDYETVGFVLSGRAELHLEGQKVILEPGDSWPVPPGPSIATRSSSALPRSRRRRRLPRSTVATSPAPTMASTGARSGSS